MKIRRRSVGIPEKLGIIMGVRLDGDEIMEHLDLGPGREVGQALKFLLEIKREEGDIEKEELKRRLNSWWSQRS